MERLIWNNCGFPNWLQFDFPLKQTTLVKRLCHGGRTYINSRYAAEHVKMVSSRWSRLSQQASLQPWLISSWPLQRAYGIFNLNTMDRMNVPGDKGLLFHIQVGWNWVIVNMTLLWRYASEVIRSHCIWLLLPKSNKVVSVLEGWKPLNVNYVYWIFKRNDFWIALECAISDQLLFFAITVKRNIKKSRSFSR